MAEGWAKNWMENERIQLARRRTTTLTSADILRDRCLESFLDGLVVASVALDESSVVSYLQDDGNLSSSPRSSITSFFTKDNSDNSKSTSCVTCDGEKCASSPRRKQVKSKAVEAMAVDGVDISDAKPKTISDVLGSGDEVAELSGYRKSRSFSLLEILRSVSLQMSLAYAGVEDESVSEEDKGCANTLGEQRSVDSLVVLCSCADSMKRKLSDMSKETIEWDIDAPTALANEGEGDMAYLRVSRQIRMKVETFMNHLKDSVMDGKLDCCDVKNNRRCIIDYQGKSI